MIQEDYDFSAQDGGLVFDVEKIEMEFSNMAPREDSFTIESDNGISGGGFVYSTYSRMKVKTERFESLPATIEYVFDPNGMEPGDTCKGQFIILSDKGEYSLDFSASMEKDYMYSSMGQIKNMFHFANLARTNWSEAVSLYYSNQFAEILTGNDRQYRTVYRGLSRSEGDEHSVDEFLIAVRKKTRNSYEISNKHFVFRNIPDNTEKSVSLKVTGWGYVRAEVSSTDDWVQPEKDLYTGEDLQDGEIVINYQIIPENLHAGRNFSFLRIKTPQETFEVQIILECNPIDMEHSANHLYKRGVSRLMRNYVAFRLGQITAEDWVKISSENLSQLTVKGDRALLVKLFEIQLLITAGKTEDALSHMDSLEYEMGNPETALPGPAYAYYLYLTSLLHQESDYVDKVSHKVKKLYHKYGSSPVLPWIMIYLKEDLVFKDDKRWEFLEEQYHSGISSPLLFAEAVHLLDKQPSLMVKLSDYEMMLLRFALKNGAVSATIGERVQFLISREKEYDDLLFDVLKKTYQIAPSKELLQSICQLLMRGNRKDEECIRWYEDAIKAELRITQLYEYYMESIPADYKELLPQMVLMYFAYQNHLDADKMALLYANVFDYRAMFPELAASYENTIEGFLKEQISKGKINRNLIKLYKKFLRPDMFDENLAAAFAPLLFAVEIKISQPGIRRTIVVHDKAVGEGKFPASKNVSYPTVYSEDYSIFLENEEGDRFVYSSMIKPERVLYTKELRDAVLPLAEGRMGILINACESSIGNVEVTDENVWMYEKLLVSDAVTLSYKKEILYNLCRFYYEKDRIRELDRLLMMAKPEVLSADDRGELIHILVARGHYAEAFDWLSRFGMEHVSDKTSMRLLSRYIERTDYADEEKIKALCQQLYQNERFDQVILRFLAGHYKGKSAQLMELIHTCEGFGIDSFELLERTLVQMIYTRLSGPERENLYHRFAKANGSTMVRKAYLAVNAYDYFINEINVPESIFSEMEMLIREDEELSRICRLAYAKHASTQAEYQWNVPILTTIVVQELKNNVVFPFFLKFASAIPQVVPFTDRSFVEYKATADSRVIMHYALERENGSRTEYRKEEMDNLYYGFFVKDFILFSGDEVSYYITEESGNKEQLTLSATLKKSDSAPVGVPWRYELLDRAIRKREEGDEAGCGEVLKDYAKMDFITRKLFAVDEG